MTESEKDNRSTGSSKDSDDSKPHGTWKHVDSSIWKTKHPEPGVHGAFSRIRNRLVWLFTSGELILLIAAPVLGLGGILTIVLAYDLGGTSFFGYYFIGLWAAIVAGFVIIVEKSGYAKNFASWDFRLKNVLYLPLAFGVVIGSILLLLFLVKGSFY